MAEVRDITWKIHPIKAPRLQKRCSKCSSTEFENSGYFRVNANGSHLDVWLIYKCVHCQSTWNLTIYSRISPKVLDQETYKKFQANDEELSVRYGVDPAFISSNHALAVPDSTIYEVEGEKPLPGETVLLHIVPDYPMDLNVAKVLSRHLEISQSAVKRLCDKGLLTSDVNIKKAHMSKTIDINLQFDVATQA